MYIGSPHPKARQSRFQLNCTKKVRRPARMNINVVQLFLEYKLPEDVLKNISNMKAKNMKQLKVALCNDKSKELHTCNLCFINVSKPHIHSHSTWTTLLTQTSVPELKSTIYKLVENGTTDVKTMKALLPA